MARPSFIKDRVEQEAEVESTSKVAKLAAKLAEAKATKVTIEEDLTQANKDIDKFTQQLHEEMSTLGVEKLSVPGLGSFTAKFKNRPNVNDSEALIAYFDSTGQGEMAKRTVHPQRLLGWVNNQLDEGLTLPECINNFRQPSIDFRKSRG